LIVQPDVQWIKVKNPKAPAVTRETRWIKRLLGWLLQRRAGGLYYSLDCGQRGSIQMRVIHDLTLHQPAGPTPADQAAICLK
jgi:hypothetical protein